MKPNLKKLPGRLALAAAAALSLASNVALAQDKTITLCWAAWDPANALVELSKDFTAKSGVKMKFEFVPWPNFADRMLNELPEFGGENPALERFARIIADRIVTDLPAGHVSAITVKLWESEQAFATYRRPVAGG